MKILLLGREGQIGRELQCTLSALGELISLGKSELDLIDQSAIRSTVRRLKPQLIVVAAGYTAVEKAEEEPDLAMAINGAAPGILAEEAALGRAAIIYYSTDYVFDGKKRNPYTEQDIPNPLNVYGRTKLAGETAIREKEVPHFIFRTGWVYGLRGNNFLLTILRLAREKDRLSIVNDQQGAPTWCRMVAEVTAQIIAQGAKNVLNHITATSGTYNLTASGHTTWHGFAEKVFELTGRTGFRCPELLAISTKQYKTAVHRPLYTILSNDKLFEHFGLIMPSWDLSLALALQDIARMQIKDLEAGE